MEKMESYCKRNNNAYSFTVSSWIYDLGSDGKMNISKIALCLAPIPLLIEIVFYFIEN